MERTTPSYLDWTLRVLCLGTLLIGICISLGWIGLAFVDYPSDGYGAADIIETLFVSGIFLNVAYGWVFVRARQPEQLAVFLLSIPVAVLGHCATAIFIAHHAYWWLFETINILLACAVAYGVLTIGHLYARLRKAT